MSVFTVSPCRLALVRRSMVRNFSKTFKSDFFPDNKFLLKSNKVKCGSLIQKGKNFVWVTVFVPSIPTAISILLRYSSVYKAEAMKTINRTLGAPSPLLPVHSCGKAYKSFSCLFIILVSSIKGSIHYNNTLFSSDVFLPSEKFERTLPGSAEGAGEETAASRCFR